MSLYLVHRNGYGAYLTDNRAKIAVEIANAVGSDIEIRVLDVSSLPVITKADVELS